MIDRIETKRLVLRAPKKSDLDGFYHYASKLTVGPSAGWLPHESKEHTKFILNDFIKKQDVWAITIKPSDIMVGSIGLKVRSFHEAALGICELGYALDDTYWNLGYVSEAVEAVIKRAFDKYDFNKIIAGHDPFNIASQKIILKNKFKFTNIDTSRSFANSDIKEVYMYELDNPNKGNKK